MLTREENELLCRVGSATPMGQMLRRYWMPALLSEDVAAGGAPQRLRLLGEDLVAFRDGTGQVGVLDEACPHRGASLALARNEECGLRCIYHGWQIATDGRILDTPAEPEESEFGQRISHRSYPVREAGGLIWAYLGPPEREPKFPRFAWDALPPEHRLIMRVRAECNWVQALEGVIDSAHSNYLHQDMIKPSATEASAEGRTRWVDTKGIDYMRRPSNDGRPRMEAQNTDYGFRYAAIRRPIVDPEHLKYVRTTLFIAPFTAMVPPPDGWIFWQTFVPMDDQHTMMIYVQTNTRAPLTDRQHMLLLNGARPGEDLDAECRKVRTRDNNFQQDRAAMAGGESYAGIQGVLTQDMAVQETMGPLYDRTREHLGASDVAVIRFRRLMLDSVLRVQQGGLPLGLERPVRCELLRGEDRVIPLDAPWQTVGAFAGEPLGTERSEAVI